MSHQVLYQNISAENEGIVVIPNVSGSIIENFNIAIGTSAPNDDLKKIKKQDGTDEYEKYQEELKAALIKKFSHWQEETSTEVVKTSLDQIYTKLYITEGGFGEVSKEHEVTQIEIKFKNQLKQERSIHCNDIFASQPGRDYQIRTVLTRGIAGIGKTVSVNKFTLDWAEGKANTDLDFIFPLSFRDLNLMKEKISLVNLLCVFFPAIKDIEIFSGDKKKILFILDGLDESRFSLNIQGAEIMSDVTKEVLVAVILANLIRGTLLQSALVWITSRPVAAGQIPIKNIDLMSEIRGFNNPQKEEYFLKKIADHTLAKRVIAHVKSCRTLYIMCHIPFFCWMTANVLEVKLAEQYNKDMPKTLTQMYIQFLILSVKKKKARDQVGVEVNPKCVRDNVLALGKLAFKELKKGHLNFYEKDLKSNGICETQASMFSGVYTQIFNKEKTMCEEKMFCFVHLTVHEFFAALYVYLRFKNENVNVLGKKWPLFNYLRESPEFNLYKAAVKRAMGDENGHFDIFLRFLFGLSVNRNQASLKELLLNNQKTDQKTRCKILKFIKEKIKSSKSVERCLNLFHCLNELNDHSLVEEIQSYLKSGSQNKAELSPSQWATLVFVLLTSDEELTVFELSSYTRSEEGLLRFLPVVKTASVAKLNACNLTVNCCEILSNGISASQLRELDLSNNNLTNAGLKKLSDGLMNSHLKTLRLRSCSLTDLSGDILASVISTASGELRELDLKDNDLQDCGVKKLSLGLKSSCCKLEKLTLSLCGVTEDGCNSLASELKSSRLKELDLSYNHTGNSDLMSVVEDPQCCLEKLRVDHCKEFWVQPGPKKYSVKLFMDPNTANTDLSLSQENRKAEQNKKKSYPDHEDRFTYMTQVLCKEGLIGRYFWEVKWKGKVYIGVAYRGMCRKGDGNECWLGRNESSWALSCNETCYEILHKNESIVLKAKPNSDDTIGVYLDWSKGTLSFYSISSGTLTLLHTIRTTFTEALYPGFFLGWVYSTVELCDATDFLYESTPNGN